MPDPQQQTPPGAFDVDSVIAPVYVGGIPLTELTKALEENRSLLAAQKATAEGQFWSSPRRPASDTTREIYEISLNSSRRANFLAFDLARFPHKAYLFYRAASTGPWLPLLNKAGRAVVATVSDSIPAVLVPPAPGDTGHPQHYGAGHWMHQEFRLRPTMVRQIRVVLVRQKTVRVPVDTTRKPVAYSLGVRGFDIGYKVAGRDDIPPTKRDPVIVTERESFASTTDILGSPMSISVRENRASDLLRGSTWKCEPQPIPNAVVNLYIDARDGQGNPQTVDRFYLDAVTSGVSMNVYHSSDIPDQTRFAASDNMLDFPLTRQGGKVTATPYGLVFPDGFGYVDIDNAGVQFNPTRPFWVGMSLAPGFDATDEDNHIFLDTGTLRIEWRDTGLWATLGNTTVLYAPTTYSDDEEEPGVPPLLFQAGQEIRFVVGFDGASLSLRVYGGGTVATLVPYGRIAVKKPSKTAAGLAAYQRVGGLCTPDDGDPGHGNFRLTSLIFKMEPTAPDEDIDAYFAAPALYVNGGPVEDGQDTSDNAVIRYLPTYQTPGAGSLNPLGFIGGPPNRYEDLVWTPINRDFRLAKGFVQFNPVAARYFKFEFTNLSAQPYDDYTPATRKVKVFPTAQVYRKAVVTSSSNTASGGATASKNAAATLYFADQARLYTVLRPAQPPDTYAPTAATYSNDPIIAARLRNQSIYFNLQAWHAQRFVPRFVDVRKHVYETVEVRHTTRVAYLVALSKIEMYRVDYATSDDTEQYLDPFSDAANLVVDTDGTPVGGWSVRDGFLATPDQMGIETVVSATSKVFASRRKVIGLQFATQQTPPVQLLPDPDLDDQTLANWRPYGDTVITPSEDFANDIGTMALVARDISANFWNTIEDRYPTWDNMEGVPWDDLEGSQVASPWGGITAAAAVSVSSRGRLYAAARVYATRDLSSPLYVQIVDGENGAVLSEEAATVHAGQVTEWYTGYTIGEGGDLSGGQTWDDLEGTIWDDLEDLGSWDQVSSSTDVNIGQVTARIIQVEASGDRWYVDNLSLFDDAIVWEFSRDRGETFFAVYDIRNDPHGAFVFPHEADDTVGYGLVWRVTGTRGAQQVDHLAIRPWYDSLPLGQPYRETIQSGGPNVALIDHYPPVVDDPRWRLWHKPIPEDWWFVFRQWLLAQREEPEPPSTIVVPSSIVAVDEGSPEEGYLITANEVLYSSPEAFAQYGSPATNHPVPGALDHVPWEPAATAILADGTLFVAAWMDWNGTRSATFLRMWHLDQELKVLGHTDYQPDDVLLDNALPPTFALAVEGNQVLLLMNDQFNDPGSASGVQVTPVFRTSTGAIETNP